MSKSLRIKNMEKAEIKAIADYLKDLEEGLYECDYREITTQGQLTEQGAIKPSPIAQSRIAEQV